MNTLDKSFIDAAAHIGKTLLISYDEAEIVMMQLVTEYENDLRGQNRPKDELMTPMQLAELYLANNVSTENKVYRDKVKREVDALSSTDVTPADTGKDKRKGSKDAKAV